MIELVQGNLNEVHLIEGRRGQVLILRKPQPEVARRRTMDQVTREHAIEGFLDNPLSGIRMRTVSEQVAITQVLRQNNIPTPTAFLTDSGDHVIEFVPDAEKLFDLWFRQDRRACQATPLVLRAVMDAHEVDLVLGDSTGKNELITPEAGIALIDFDMKLLGPEAREFEFANLIYRLSRAAHRGDLNNCLF